MCGTPPTLVSSGTVFTKFRNQTLDGKSKNGLWAEWGVNDESDVHDVDLWYLTNPSLGYHLTERAIADELTANGVEFISEKSFDDLRSDSNGVPRYDFYLPKQNAVIEFQGKQHYQETTFFGENNSLEKNRARDRLKREYATSKGMKYIEVHFSELGNINIMKRI